MKLRTIDGLEVRGKVVLLRCDFNVPLSEEGEINQKETSFLSPSCNSKY